MFCVDGVLLQDYLVLIMLFTELKLIPKSENRHNNSNVSSDLVFPQVVKYYQHKYFLQILFLTIVHKEKHIYAYYWIK